MKLFLIWYSIKTLKTMQCLIELEVKISLERIFEMLNLIQMSIQQFIDLLGFQFVLLFKLLLFKISFKNYLQFADYFEV